MKITVKLPLAVAAALALVLAAALLGIQQLNRAIAVYGGSVADHHAHEVAVDAVLGQFKVQVQEWKNVLLRGKDPKRLEQHWDREPLPAQRAIEERWVDTDLPFGFKGSARHLQAELRRKRVPVLGADVVRGERQRQVERGVLHLQRECSALDRDVLDGHLGSIHLTGTHAVEFVNMHRLKMVKGLHFNA